MEDITIYSPLQGKIVPLEKIADQRFSNLHFGPGVAILPHKNSVCAPFDGMLLGVAKNRHGVWFRSPEGIEVLVHVGLDTVFLNGAGFSTTVEPGTHVIRGQVVLEFDRRYLRRQGYSSLTPVVVTNTELPGELHITKRRRIGTEQVLMYVSCS